jgi:hypothetical protein
MKSIDLDNATYEKEGLKMLDKFNPDSEFKLTTSSQNRTAAPVSGDYGDLLK